MIRTIVISLGAIIPTIASQGLSPRNPYYGGYALPGTPADGAVNGCPSGTLTCSNKVFTFCCPNFTFCGPYQLGPYCCPTNEDCGSLLGAGDTCADPSWTLYEDAFIWCCKNDTVGLALGDGECQPKALSYSSAEYARTLTQANDAPPPTSWIGGTPTGLSTSGAKATTTSSAATGKSGTTGTATGTAAGTSSPAAASSSKTSSGVTFGAGFSVVSMMIFGGTLVLAVLL